MTIGFGEFLLLAFIGVVFLKPEELRSIAKKLGHWMGEMRKISREFTSELEREADLGDIRQAARKVKEDIRQSIMAIPDGSPQPVEIKKNPFIEENPHEPADWTGGVGTEPEPQSEPELNTEQKPIPSGSRAPRDSDPEPAPIPSPEAHAEANPTDSAHDHAEENREKTEMN